MPNFVQLSHITILVIVLALVATNYTTAVTINAVHAINTDLATLLN